MLSNLKNKKVAILAPSAQIGSIDKIAKGLEYLKSLGLDPVLGKHTLKQYRYMAGTDIERAEDINEAFANPQIDAIFCVRAAAGALRILPYLDYEMIKNNKKPVIGFCDNAALEAAIYKKSGVCSLNGFSLTYDFRDDELSPVIKQSFENLLRGKKIQIKSGICRNKGTAKGELVCSNLTTLLYLSGGEYFPDLSGKILLIEDV
ncbi:MAG: LD-carboxypeptidase, partial [Alphaproteobacteria bacterium]|nr:LD-carboxypeptidase [Alphaproteobacteria bacterium]